MAPPPAIELRHLRYFIAVLEELHFGRAAERLHIAQPPLSQAIRKLEAEIGVQLFHRTTRVVVATEAAEVLAEGAREVLAALDLAIAETRRAGGATAVLRIGCIPQLTIERLQSFLTALHDADPRLVAEVTHLFSHDQVTRLIRRELDAGILYHVGEVHGVQWQPLFGQEPLVAFVPIGHVLARHKVVRPPDLKNETLITYPRASNPAVHDRVYADVEAAGYQFREIEECSGTSHRDLMLAVLERSGVALAPGSLKEVAEVGRIVICKPIDPPVFMPDVVLAWAAAVPPRLDRVLGTVRDVAREIRVHSDRGAINEG